MSDIEEKENGPPPAKMSKRSEKLPYVYTNRPGRAKQRFTPGKPPRKQLGSWPNGAPGFSSSSSSSSTDSDEGPQPLPPIPKKASPRPSMKLRPRKKPKPAQRKQLTMAWYRKSEFQKEAEEREEIEKWHKRAQELQENRKDGDDEASSDEELDNQMKPCSVVLEPVKVPPKLRRSQRLKK